MSAADIERAARALSESDVRALKEFLAKEGMLNRLIDFREQLLPWEAMNEVSKRDYVRRVRAVLEAIREPTMAMVLAGRRKPELPSEDEMRVGSADCDVNAIRPTNDDNGRANSHMTMLRFQAMIDELLKE